MAWFKFVHFLQSQASKVFSESPSIQSHSPIANLPNELLLIIFGHCVSSSLLEHDPPSWFTPILMSRVSRHWRTLIVSSPSLWTHVPISPSQSRYMLQSFMQNSAPLPIEVTVYPWPVAHSSISAASLDMQLHTLLEAECDRERIVALKIDSTGLDDQVDRVIRTWLELSRGRRVPALKSVYLKGASHSVWTGSCFFDRNIAPVLNTLIVEDMPVAWFQVPSPRRSLHMFPPNLTTLIWKHSPSFDRVSILEFSQFVSAFPSVETIELHGPVVDFEGPLCFESKYSASASPVSRTGSITFKNVNSVRIAEEVNSQSSLNVLFHIFPSLTHDINRHLGF